MLKPDLNQLTVCHGLLSDKIFSQIAICLSDKETFPHYHALSAQLLEIAETYGLSGNLFASYSAYLLTQCDTIAARSIEEYGSIGSSLQDALHSDAALLLELSQIKPSSINPLFSRFDDYKPTHPNDTAAYLNLQPKLNAAKTPADFVKTLLDHYHAYGYGAIANYRAFQWSEDGKLSGIKHFDTIQLSDLVGYEEQKRQLLTNTKAFLAHRPANNVLLVGARGTGKSSAVKALANAFFEQGLRLLQLTKPQLLQLPQIMQKLRLLRHRRFILFLDDLSFEDFEPEYKSLKSAIEGGVETKPDNVLIYATSNRRHLIKESWKDRADKFVEEVHRSDSVNETISLSDRFGLTLYYQAPSQQEYLHIAAVLLRRHGIELTDEELRVQATAWELSHSGRSGRIAQQFVDYYLGFCR